MPHPPSFESKNSQACGPDSISDGSTGLTLLPNCSYRWFAGAGPFNCSITNQTLHEWFTVGVRGVCDIALF